MMGIRAKPLSWIVFISSLLMMGELFAPGDARAGNTADLALTVRVVPEIVPPGDITDLKAVTGAQDGQVNLTWTSPGDNGFVGDLISGSFLIKFSTSPIGSFTGPPDVVIATNAAVSSAQGYVVQGLTPGDTYYFAMVALDRYGNRSLWSTGGASNPENFARAGFTPGAPDAVADLTAAPGTGEGDVLLSWTAPTSNFAALSSYEVRFATFSAASVGSTTAWTASASSAALTPAQPPGMTETRVIGGLFPAATWYFSIKSVNSAGAASPIDARAAGPLQASALPRSLPPAAPSGLGAAAGLRRATLAWTDLTPAGKGLDFAYYRVERSTDQAGFVAVATTTGASYLDLPLTAMVTYYYRLVARDLSGNDGAATSSVEVVPFTIRPMEPLGVSVLPSSAAVTISWSPTGRFFDGTPFISTGAPALDELGGYSVWRSTNICDPFYTRISTLGVSSTSITDATGGLNYYYRLFSFNSLGASTNVVTLSSLGERSYFVDDCMSSIVLDDATAASLNAAGNGMGDIRIISERRPQDVGSGVYQSVEWRASLDGSSELRGYALAKPARVVLHFDAVNGVPVAGVASAGAAGATVKDLGVFWKNGQGFQKLYGRVDPVGQTVTVESPNLGVYQIRAQARSSGVVFDVSNLSSRVITPNGDGFNDVAIFTYDPGPENVRPAGRISDLRGAFVAEMTPGLVPNTLTWNGMMNGLPARGGVYAYRIIGGGKTFTGTVVVAR